MTILIGTSGTSWNTRPPRRNARCCWSRRTGIALVVARPSVVVGHAAAVAIGKHLLVLPHPGSAGLRTHTLAIAQRHRSGRLRRRVAGAALVEIEFAAQTVSHFRWRSFVRDLAEIADAFTQIDGEHSRDPYRVINGDAFRHERIAFAHAWDPATKSASSRRLNCIFSSASAASRFSTTNACWRKGRQFRRGSRPILMSAPHAAATAASTR